MRSNLLPSSLDSSRTRKPSRMRPRGLVVTGQGQPVSAATSQWWTQTMPTLADAALACSKCREWRRRAEALLSEVARGLLRTPMPLSPLP
jgi:hypothetical protein